MRYAEDRRSGDSLKILVSILTVFVCSAGLLGVRLYASNLESRVSAAANKIEMYKDQNTLMERQRADLLSPENVYTYAREQLNMTDAEDVPVIYVDAKDAQMAKANSAPEQSSEIASAFDRFNPFVNKAHAKD